MGSVNRYGLYLLLITLLLGQFSSFSMYGHFGLYIFDILLVVLYILNFRKVIENIRSGQVAIFKPMVLFFTAVTVSLVLNMSRYTLQQNIYGWLYLMRFFTYASVYFLAVSGIWKQTDRDNFLKLLPVGLAGLGFIQFWLYPSLRNMTYLGWDPHFYRMFSSLLDPNFLGLILVFGFLYLLQADVKNEYFRFILLGVLSLAIIMTFSRSALVGWFGALAYWAIKKRKWLVLLLIPAVISGFILWPKNSDVSSLIRVESSVSRLNNWRESIKFALTKPIFGYGFNTLRFSDFSIAPQSGLMDTHAGAGIDNSFLFIFAASGIIGLAAFLYLVYQLFFRTQMNLRPIIIAAVIHSFFNNSLMYPWIIIYIFMVSASRLFESGTGVIARSRESSQQ